MSKNSKIAEFIKALEDGIDENFPKEDQQSVEASIYDEVLKGLSRLQDKKEAEKEEVLGYCEGDVCGRGGCTGIIKESEVENCNCMVAPPCSACVRNRGYCEKCGWDAEDEEQEV